MATSYTSLLRLAQPAQGELSGTWGTVVNDNITAMIEEAIAGSATINTWVADSATLSTADGSTDQSRVALLFLTDTTVDLTGAGSLICPTATKSYIVKNDTGQTITVKTSAGTGVAIVDGSTAHIFCDGTNVENTLAVASLTVSGTVELATVAETNTGTDATRAVTPDGLDGWTGSAQITTLGTIATGVWQGTEIGSGYLPATEVSEDTTPVLGGNLDVSGNSIVSVSAGDIAITPDTTGDVILDGLKWPQADGTADYVLKTDGAGQLSWTTSSVSDASTTVKGIVELATGDETNTGTDFTRAVTPDGLDDWTGSAQITTLGTISSLVATTADINAGTVDAVVGGTTPAAGTFTALKATAEIVEKVYTLTGTTPALDPANGTIQTWTLTAESTPTDSLATGEYISLIVDTPSSNVIWTSVVDQWVGGSAPTLDTTNDNVIELWKVGTTVYGAFVGVVS